MNKPNFYENYDSFIERVGDTRETNKAFREARIAYFKNGIGDYPFLLRTEQRINKIDRDYALELEQELDEIYSDIALFIALNGTSSAWDVLITNEGIEDILTQMYQDTGVFINERYSSRYNVNPLQSDLLNSFMVGVLLGRMHNGNSRASGELFRGTTIKEVQKVIDFSSSKEEAVEMLRNKRNLPRARAISNTEIGIAQSASEMYTMRQVAHTQPVKKYWVGVLDDRIRDSHFVATQYYNPANAIPLEQRFNINGNLMLHPRDYTADPKEVINCRCYLGYILS